MPSTSALLVVLVIISVVMLISIVVFFIINNEYNKLVGNPSNLCLSGSCAFPSNKCGAVPFKVDDQGQLVCANPSIFNLAVPSGVTNNYV